MEQRRLSSLGTIATKNEIADELDFSDMIKDFAEELEKLIFSRYLEIFTLKKIFLPQYIN